MSRSWRSVCFANRKFMMDFEKLSTEGYCTFTFTNVSAFKKLQNLIKQFLSFSAENWHLHITSQDDHHQLIVRLGKHIADSHILIDILNTHVQVFKELCGPDIDIQSVPDVRVTRPLQEKDIVTWHRDTFYGGSPWQLNIWFPVFDLPEGSGLLLIPGSHVQPSLNVRSVSESMYPSHMIDDSIAEMDQDRIQLLAPLPGEAVVFFGCVIHRACNPSTFSRFSLDIRLRSAQISDEENPFYKPFCRGLIGKCVSKFAVSSSCAC